MQKITSFITLHRAKAFLLLGILVGSVGLYTINTLTDKKDSVDVSYPLLAKRIQIENPNDVKINFSELRKQLDIYVKQQQNPDSLSIYYEFLPSGVAININDKNESIAASLMKLPVVMNLFKASELGLVDLDRKIPLQEQWLNQEYGKLYLKGAGYELTLRDAAKLTLRDSDNTALLMIWDSIEKAGLPQDEQSLDYLDVNFSLVEDGRALIGARSYSSILKCLYLACYNTKSSSQEMLEFLSESTFTNRLTRGISPDIKVSHKIGTYNIRYQSDCGIVYLDKNNYILCVMIEGQDPLASDQIAQVSKIVHDYMTKPR